jgi:hypothetical protein
MEAFIVAVAFWPMVVTKLTDLVRNAFDQADRAPKWLWNVVSLGLGVAVALLYELNYAELIPNLPPKLQGATGVTAQVLTGLGIGAIGSFWHETMDLFSSKAKSGRMTGTQG